MWPLPNAVRKANVSLNWFGRKSPGPSIPTAIGSATHRLFITVGKPTAPWIAETPVGGSDGTRMYVGFGGRDPGGGSVGRNRGVQRIRKSVLRHCSRSHVLRLQHIQSHGDDRADERWSWFWVATHPGEHTAIVDEATWSGVQERLRHNGPLRRHAGPQQARCAAQRPRALRPLRGHDGAHLFDQEWNSHLPVLRVLQGAEAGMGLMPVPVAARGADRGLCCRADQADRARPPRCLSTTLAKCREQAEAQRESINGELAIVERDLASVHADLARVAADAASSPHAAARLADLHEKVRVLEDTDVKPVRPLDEMCPPEVVAWAACEQLDIVTNAAMGVPG